MKYMNITEQLKELRESKKLKIYDISLLLGMEKDTYGKYERENVTIPIKHLITVCDFFEVSIDYIFNNSKIKNYQQVKPSVNIILAGNRLKEFRKDNKLTQEKLANLLNTNKSVVCNYEKGRHLIATPFLYTICKKYHISADYLLGKTDKPKYLD